MGTATTKKMQTLRLPSSNGTLPAIPVEGVHAAEGGDEGCGKEAQRHDSYARIDRAAVVAGLEHDFRLTILTLGVQLLSPFDSLLLAVD
tara:strand:- start:25315 stop:25581 length:267 start_codon:yes stop_codon:yes gene_type:complete